VRAVGRLTALSEVTFHRSGRFGAGARRGARRRAPRRFGSRRRSPVRPGRPGRASAAHGGWAEGVRGSVRCQGDPVIGTSRVALDRRCHSVDGVPGK